MRALAALLMLAPLAFAVEDGSFDKGVGRWFLINNSGSATLEHNRKKKHLVFTKARAGGMDMLRYDLKKAPAPGTRFKLKARFRGDAIGNGWFKIFFYDAQGKDLGQGRDVKPLRGTYDWKEIALDNKAPEGTASATIFILLVMPGTLHIDDVVVEGVAGGGAARAPLKDKKLVAWLDRNAIAVQTLKIDGEMRDLAPLARQLRGVRIVQLGENTHGDGLAFAAKARLVRWLHERMGFDVLAFESGMWECERANKLIKPGADPKTVMRASIFPIWHTKRTVPLFEYLVRQSGTRKPMTLTGFDLRESGKTLDVVSQAAIHLTVIRAPQLVRPTPATVLAHWRKHRKQLVEMLDDREYALIERALVLREMRPRFEAMKGDARLNFRDKQMAETLIWLANERYPKSKIICWAATAHQAHGLKYVETRNGPMYKTLTMMGDHVHKAFGKKCFTVGFVAHGGWAGLWHLQNFELPVPHADSMEQTLFRYGKPRLIVPLRARTPFRWPMFMAPMSYGRDIKAPWPKVLDAIFYIEEMEPARHMGG